MDVQRTITIHLPDDPDLRATLDAFRSVEQEVSETAFNGGTPLRAIDLHRAEYERVKGTLNSQMTCTALRLTAGAYAAAKKNRTRRVRLEAKRKAKHLAKGWTYRPRTIKPLGVCTFTKPTAMFLVGDRGRDADFRADGTLSIWTVAGRKRLPYSIVPAHVETLSQATRIDSMTVIERNGNLYGRVVVTIEVPEPTGVSPVGIDLNETNAVVAVDVDGREFFQTGLATKVKNRRTMQTVGRLQARLATRKADGTDTQRATYPQTAVSSPLQPYP